MKLLANVLVGLSVVAVILSIVGAFGTDLWLASTQWILVAGVLGIYALFAKME